MRGELPTATFKRSDKRSGSRSGPPSSPSLEAGSLRWTGRWGRSPEVRRGLCPRLASLPVGRLWSPASRRTPCLCCHRPSFPKPVSCSLSCEDPCHTGLPRGNHLNGTSATTLFQMGYQLGFWDMGPQHELPTIPPTQAPPPGTAGVGPRSWASWSRGRGAAVGRGAGDTSLRPGNQD